MKITFVFFGNFPCLVKAGIIILLFSLCSCAPVKHIPDDSNKLQGRHKVGLPEGSGWWYARFRFDWSDRTQPKWYMGMMLAGEVIAPILQQNRHEIRLWRFHRRAGRDDMGHIFSFIFYSKAKTAQLIYREIEQDPLVISLRQQKKITWVGFDNINEINKPDIADSSDPVWPAVIQRTWPEYIMGACQMWLNLVNELRSKQDNGQTRATLYKEVHKQLTDLWQKQGQHVWLHHLNALYAYQPMWIRY